MASREATCINKSIGSTISITGFPGLSFIIMLANVGLAFLIIHWWQEKKIKISVIIAVGSVIAIIGLGLLTIPSAPAIGGRYNYWHLYNR